MASRLSEQGKFNRGHRWQSCGRNHTLAYRDLATHNISIAKEHRPRADRRDTLNSELGHETWLLLLPNESRLSCGAELEGSQGEFYNTARKTFSGSIGDGRRQLQALLGCAPQVIARVRPRQKLRGALTVA